MERHLETSPAQASTTCRVPLCTLPAYVALGWRERWRTDRVGAHAEGPTAAVEWLGPGAVFP